MPVCGLQSMPVGRRRSADRSGAFQHTAAHSRYGYDASGALCEEGRRSGCYGLSSIGAGKDDLLRGFFTCVHAMPGLLWLIERDATDGGACFFLDALLVFGRSRPVAACETAFDLLFEFVVGCHVGSVFFAEGQRALVECLLNVRQERHQPVGQSVLWHE